ncbi:MAG: hypothetical protein FWD48_01180 [Oscillospiraceae bacterium]|nr:hypothetical protein [Oscillospiraceae bacterium]
MSNLNKSWFNVDIESNVFDRLQLFAMGMKEGESFRQWNISLGSIIKRASQAARTEAWRGVKEKYNIKQEHFYNYTKIKTYESGIINCGNSANADVTFIGKKIPLYYFGTHKGKEKSKKPIKSQIIKGGNTFTYKRAFYMFKNYRYGIYERTTPKRLPIREITALAGAQMIGDDEISERVAEKIIKTIDERAEHEITRLLNKWGTNWRVK